MGEGVRILLEGQEILVGPLTRVVDLMSELGLHPEAHVPVVNGSPAPERMYLSEGDEVRFVRVTVHVSGV